MSIRSKYFLLVFILHGILTILIFKVLEDRKLLFILSEVLIILSLYFCYLIYRSFIRPIELMKSGTDAILDQDFNVKFVASGSAEVDQLVFTYNEMMDRLREEKQRTMEQSYFLESLISESPVGIIIMDFDQQISLINEMATSYLQVTDLVVGRTLEEITHPLSVGISALESGNYTTITITGNKKYKIRKQSVIHKGFPRIFVMIEELSEEIREAEKLAYSKIIRMMAHEVNNSIGAINSILGTTIENAFEDRNDGETWQEALQIALDRNDKLNSFMKNFAKVVRLPEPSFEQIDLNQSAVHVVKSMKDFAAGKNIELTLNSNPEPVMVAADISLIEQVLVNIIKNAIESIETDGRVEVHTSSSTPQLKIIDNGKGINPQDKDQIFSPFFSTKVDGQGIGLMMTKEILGKHKASYHLYTDKKSGLTNFEISFTA